jgi:hypothetical protein
MGRPINALAWAGQASKKLVQMQLGLFGPSSCSPCKNWVGPGSSTLLKKLCHFCEKNINKKHEKLL